MKLPANHYGTGGFMSRRELLCTAGAGFGGLALHWLLNRDARAAEPSPIAFQSTRPPHLPARAKSVIFLFMFGGPSGIDLFDPKPALERWDGKPLQGFNPADNFFEDSRATAMASPYRFARHGRSGIDISEKFPNLGHCADDLCIIRSVKAENNNHRPAIFQMNTGFQQAGRPSFGSWVSYGLGSGSDNLPAFVVMLDAAGGPFGGALNWSSGFMPAAYQGVTLRPTGEPIADLNPPRNLTPEQQRARLDLLGRINEQHLAANPGESGLAARIASFELAYRMQMHAPEAVDISRESEATRRLYGLDNRVTEPFGRNCLLARRLVERGVRFVQLYSGGGDAMGTTGWDAHADLKQNHDTLCPRVDRPIAGLLVDLKQRGLLDETLVIWGGEFGRLPTVQGSKGRDHNPHGFTMWLAGGGVKGGYIHGATDEFGYRAVENVVTLPDLHATCLHLLGLDHLRLTYPFMGRNMRLTDVSGEAVRDVIA
jgi:hypothetical protein